MRKEMSSLDLFFLQKELQAVCKGVIRKIHQEKKRLQVEIFVSGKGELSLFFEPGKIFLTEYKRKFPEPSAFCMFLRKHLAGQKILDIRQHDFERIIELETEGNILIFELFSRGNIILCDKSLKILMPLEAQKWSEREIAKNQQYKYPPEVKNPFSVSVKDLKTLFASEEKSVASFLATNLNLSGLYAEEVCTRADVDKKKKTRELDEDEILRIYEAIHSLVKTFDPQTIYENNEILDFAPFAMKIYEGKKAEKAGLTHIVDDFFSKEKKKPERGAKELEKIKEKQMEAIENLKKGEAEYRKKAEALYAHSEEIKKITSLLESYKREKLSWEDIKKKLEGVEIEEAKSLIILNIDDLKIEINFRKSVHENANKFFEEAKKKKKKILSAQNALEKTAKRIEEYKPEAEIRIEKKREWFEKFRWFLTSNRLLVIAGRSAEQNELIYKKYIDKSDIVLHADIAGAPLTVIKSENKKIEDQDIKEAASFSAAYSSAWKKGLAAVDIYWINPEQVSKSPPSGTFLAKGAFAIRGEKNYLRNVKLEFGIGVKIDDMAKPLCGTLESVKKNADYFVVLVPGDLPQMELAKKIKAKIIKSSSKDAKKILEAVPLEEIQRVIPSGKGDLK